MQFDFLKYFFPCSCKYLTRYGSYCGGCVHGLLSCLFNSGTKPRDHHVKSKKKKNKNTKLFSDAPIASLLHLLSIVGCFTRKTSLTVLSCLLIWLVLTCANEAHKFIKAIAYWASQNIRKLLLPWTVLITGICLVCAQKNCVDTWPRW